MVTIPLSWSWQLLPLGVLLLLGRELDRLLLLLFILTGNRGVLLSTLAPYINWNFILSIVFIGVSILLTLHLNSLLVESHSPLAHSSEFPSKPLLFPCRTHHTRLFPEKHSFSYSYLLVGIPVGWSGCAGGLVSAGERRSPFSWVTGGFYLKSQHAWFHVDGDEHLLRGSSPTGLQGKLKEFLASQGEDYHDYPHAYLLTAARFMGYASNPVSIWCLYSAQKVLTATILEVNNTFGEKHSYFLKAKAAAAPPDLSPPNLLPKTSELQKNKPQPFTETWAKDFYVSVFNSRDGAYSLVLHDPLYPSMTGPGTINTTITLRSDSGQTKIAARLFSTGPGIDPSTLSLFGKAMFLARWWWVGLATFPRTVVQAFVLLFRRGMPWVFRPEPRRNTLPRGADETERVIELIFRGYLQHLVECASLPMIVSYTAAGLNSSQKHVMHSLAAQRRPAEAKRLEIQVLTPLFYSRFAHYSLSVEALLQESGESATIWISQPDLLPELIPPSHRILLMESSRSERLLFTVIGRLRSPPYPITTNVEEKFLDCKLRVPWTLTVSRRETEMEEFMLSHRSQLECWQYSLKMLKLLVSEYIALGWTELLDLELFLLRAATAWVIGRNLKL